MDADMKSDQPNIRRQNSSYEKARKYHDAFVVIAGLVNAAAWMALLLLSKKSPGFSTEFYDEEIDSALSYGFTAFLLIYCVYLSFDKKAILKSLKVFVSTIVISVIVMIIVALPVWLIVGIFDDNKHVLLNMLILPFGVSASNLLLGNRYKNGISYIILKISLSIAIYMIYIAPLIILYNKYYKVFNVPYSDCQELIKSIERDMYFAENFVNMYFCLLSLLICQRILYSIIKRFNRL